KFWSETVRHQIREGMRDGDDGASARKHVYVSCSILDACGVRSPDVHTVERKNHLQWSAAHDPRSGNKHFVRRRGIMGVDHPNVELSDQPQNSPDFNP